MPKKAILLLNLGTPDNCDPRSVRRYLTEFLNDPRVIDIPALSRFFLVNTIIIPFRYKKTAAAYQQIWGEEGSPLLVYSEALTAALRQKLGEEYQVELGMRYGNPSIKSALQKFKDCNSLQIIPLFPQYSAAATGSAIEKTLSLVAGNWNIPALKITQDFYADPGFIRAYADIIHQHTVNKSVDMLLFSYHGLPERHINKSECRAQCDHIHACPTINTNNQFCYRAQCYATSKLLAQELNLAADKFMVSFQSRLGRTPWIKPYTDVVLPELIQKNIRSLAVVCPSFAVDCLETLEEVNMRAREQWLALGGKEFLFIPCLNASELFVDALFNMVD